MNASGMTLIVKNTTRLIAGFITVFGIYVALTGHLGPGGGFAGGVILAAAGILIVLSFGRTGAGELLRPDVLHLSDSGGAWGFLLVGLLGYLAGGFFVNFIPTGRIHHLVSGGTIPLSTLAILVKVGAGLVGAFVALSAYRLMDNRAAASGKES